MAIYLKSFCLPRVCDEADFVGYTYSVTDCYYPFNVFEPRKLPWFEFEPITIFCGDNGSGKTTLINVIADYLGAKRCGKYEEGFMEDFLYSCRGSVSENCRCRVITSQDIFDYMAEARLVNARFDEKLADLHKEYCDKAQTVRLTSMEEYEKYKQYMETRRMSATEYVAKNMPGYIRMLSGGETAINFFTREINEPALYLLDEPENSLSPKYQLKLKRHIEKLSAEGYQFIIATHSPFFLALEGAKIYDLNDRCGKVKKWTELENSKIYYEFFKENEAAFKKLTEEK